MVGMTFILFLMLHLLIYRINDQSILIVEEYKILIAPKIAKKNIKRVKLKFQYYRARDLNRNKLLKDT